MDLLMGARTVEELALCADRWVKRHREDKKPSKSSILVGDKAAGKTPLLAINHLFG
jgi:hypothetical protein